MVILGDEEESGGGKRTHGTWKKRTTLETEDATKGGRDSRDEEAGEGESQKHTLLKNGIMASNTLYGDLEKNKNKF